MERDFVHGGQADKTKLLKEAWTGWDRLGQAGTGSFGAGCSAILGQCTGTIDSYVDSPGQEVQDWHRLGQPVRETGRDRQTGARLAKITGSFMGLQQVDRAFGLSKLKFGCCRGSQVRIRRNVKCKYCS